MNHSDNTPFRIYVADLNAYNAGRLIGGWLTVSDYSDEEELGRAISDQLADPAHEHAIHDSEGVRVSEHVSTARLLVLGHACAQCADSHELSPHLAVFSHQHSPP